MAEAHKSDNPPDATTHRGATDGEDHLEPSDVAPGPLRYWRWSLVGFAVLIALVAVFSLA